MKATPRIVIQLLPSHWHQRLSVCSALLLGAAIGIILHDLAWVGSWFLAAILAAIAALAFILIARRQSTGQSTKLGLNKMRLILAHAKQVWIGQESAPPLDAPLPELRKLQRYLGLIWISNSAGAQALIWPDSISAEEHRQLRIWLGIHAHQKS